METPPGAQAQAGWTAFPRVSVGGVHRDLVAFLMQLSFSRGRAPVWRDRKHVLAWLTVHNGAFTRLGGVPATVPINDEKTVVVTGAGAWGRLYPVYERYAQILRFRIDPCAVRGPDAKGKIERDIREGRVKCGPYRRTCNSLEELQADTDEPRLHTLARPTSPTTGTAVLAAWEFARAHLRPLFEPFHVGVTRRTGPDCAVVFERRTYSVPCALLGRVVEVRD